MYGRNVHGVERGKENQMRVMLTPTISVELHQPKGKIMSDMKLFDADGEVHVGDVVHFNGKACYVEKIRQDGLVTVIRMNEQKMTLNVLPHQIGCVFGKGE